MEPQRKMVNEVTHDSGIATSETDRSSTTPEATPGPSTSNALSAPTTSTKRRPIKPKLIKCKTCNFSTYAKEEYWTHAQVHMTGNIFTCPECPFVTKFKHHLKYHISKHTGDKPVQCEHCDYSCITKTMLKSHLRSHLNVCEYRCRECGFETKYHHKLKTHVKRHSIEQATPEMNEEVPRFQEFATNEDQILPFQFDLLSHSVNPELRQKIQFCIWMAQWEALKFLLMNRQPVQEEPLDLSVRKIQQ